MKQAALWYLNYFKYTYSSKVATQPSFHPHYWRLTAVSKPKTVVLYKCLQNINIAILVDLKVAPYYSGTLLLIKYSID